MSIPELDRLAVIEEVVAKRLRQRVAAARLGMGVRQVQRLVRRYRADGPAGLVSQRRGRHPNNTISAAVRAEVMTVVHEYYKDFGPTFACEKLVEQHGFRLLVETLRQWMIAEGLWTPKARKPITVHPSRPRRACLGELVQIDGSPHDWLEGRGPYCTLIVFVDDATSRLQALRLVPAETTQAYLETLREYLAAHGRPVAFYSDQYSVFRINQAGQEAALTQFSRALKTLDIEIIHASSPQAKGRVERANQTLQDRLVKELRLRGIHDMDAANGFLPEFMTDYNRRFAVDPRDPVDAHRPGLHEAAELDLILCLHHTRTLTKNLTFQFHCREYQLQGYGKGYRLRGAQVTVCEAFDGAVTVLYKGRELSVKVFAAGEAVPVADEKTVNRCVDRVKATQRIRPAYKPAPDHPWRRAFKPRAETGLAVP